MKRRYIAYPPVFNGKRYSHFKPIFIDIVNAYTSFLHISTKLTDLTLLQEIGLCRHSLHLQKVGEYLFLVIGQVDAFCYIVYNIGVHSAYNLDSTIIRQQIKLPKNFADDSLNLLWSDGSRPLTREHRW